MLHDIAGHEELTQRIIQCGITVHEHFGPGLLESVYKPCLSLELRAAGLQVETTRRVPLVYKSLQLDSFYCPDIIVNDTVIVELKCVEMLTAVHSAQLITYLKLTGLPLGLLMNFKVALLTRGTRRVVRPDLYRKAYDPAEGASRIPFRATAAGLKGNRRRGEGENING